MLGDLHYRKSACGISRSQSAGPRQRSRTGDVVERCRHCAGGSARHHDHVGMAIVDRTAARRCDDDHTARSASLAVMSPAAQRFDRPTFGSALTASALARRRARHPQRRRLHGRSVVVGGWRQGARAVGRIRPSHAATSLQACAIAPGKSDDRVRCGRRCREDRWRPGRPRWPRKAPLVQSRRRSIYGLDLGRPIIQRANFRRSNYAPNSALSNRRTRQMESRSEATNSGMVAAARCGWRTEPADDELDRPVAEHLTPGSDRRTAYDFPAHRRWPTPAQSTAVAYRTASRRHFRARRPSSPNPAAGMLKAWEPSE